MQYFSKQELEQNKELSSNMRVMISNIDIEKITYCYNENGDLKYKRFLIKEERKEDNLMPYNCNSSKLGSNPGSSCASRDGAKFKSK